MSHLPADSALEAPRAVPGPGEERSGIAAIRGFLDRLRLVGWSARVGAAVAGLAAVAAVAVTLNTLVAERSPLSPWVGFAVGLCGTGGVVAAGFRAARALRYPSRTAAARLAEARAPELRNDVESSLELEPLLRGGGSGPVSRPLVGALVGSTGERLRERAARRLVSWRELRRAAALLAASLLPLAALAAFPPGVPASAVRALLDPRVYWPLGRIALRVAPGDARIARGGELLVSAAVTGGRPAAVLVKYEGAAAGDGLAEMRRGADGVWTWRFAAVAGDFRYRVLAGSAGSPWYEVRAADAPAAGNFEIAYTYPAYSGLGARRVSGGGDLEALKGTTAEITFTASADLARATLVAGAARAAVQSLGDRRHRVALFLNGERSYRLELEDAEGLGNGGGPEYAIRYLPDATPVAELIEPAGSLESDPRASLAVRWRASDDYGLSGVSFVVRRASGERRQALPLGESGRSASGEHSWDLGALDAAPGEVITAHIEAADNDTISGPKTGASAVLTVSIADPRKKREEIREQMEKLTDDLLQVLAEELDLEGRYGELEKAAADWERFPWDKAAEAAARQEAAREAAARAEQRANDVAGALEQSPEAREETLFQAELIARGLRQLRAGKMAEMGEMAEGLAPPEATAEEAAQKSAFMAKSAGEVARTAEQLALMAESMQRERGLADVERNAQEMAQAEDRLLKDLEKLSPGDRRAAEEVLRQLDEIERSLRELAESLLAQNKALPEEFLNSDALKGLDLGEALGDLERIRRMLAAGDVEGARRAARELAAKLADLRDRLRQAEEEFEEKAARALQRMRGNTVPELQRLAEEQRVLLERTGELERTAGPRLEQVLREMQRAGNTAPPPTEADLLTPQERGRAEALAREQEALRVRAGRLAEEVAALRAALPFLPAEVPESLGRASGLMGEAAGRLSEREPARALPPERSALAELQRSRDAAQQALDEMSQMQGMRQGTSGMPMRMMAAPGSPGGQQTSSDLSRGRRSGGRRGTDVRNFLIPGKQDFQVPRMYREEILKSLRDGYPPQYEERIRDYYQRITE